jgi:hypothetical protein
MAVIDTPTSVNALEAAGVDGQTAEAGSAR